MKIRDLDGNQRGKKRMPTIRHAGLNDRAVRPDLSAAPSESKGGTRSRARAGDEERIARQILELGRHGVQPGWGIESDGRIGLAAVALADGESATFYAPTLSFGNVELKLSRDHLGTLLGVLDPKHEGLAPDELKLLEMMQQLEIAGMRFAIGAALPYVPAALACFTLLRGEKVRLDGGMVNRELHDPDGIKRVYEAMKTAGRARQEMQGRYLPE